MKLRIQIGCLLIVLGIGAGMAFPSAAQNREANKPPQQQRQQQRQQPRQAPRPERRQQRQDARTAPNGRPNADRPRNMAPSNRPTESMSTLGGGNRPPNAGNQPGQRPNFNPNRPPNASNPQTNPRRFRDLTPEQKRSWEKFNRLPPQKQQEMREAARNWQKLTPEQQGHIKNDVFPKWQQMPPDRQRAIRQRLGVLQNMPESARNQHLSDPNFTRGMSEEDKAMLRDLSHMHVGAPDPPNE
jgi:hypothetical protein